MRITDDAHTPYRFRTVWGFLIHRITLAELLMRYLLLEITNILHFNFLVHDIDVHPRQGASQQLNHHVAKTNEVVPPNIRVNTSKA